VLIYNAYTKAFRSCYNEVFLGTMKDEFEVRSIYLNIDTDVNFRSSHHAMIDRYAFRWVMQGIKDNWDGIIAYITPDVQFFDYCEPLFRKVIEGVDLSFQREHAEGRQVNGGVVVIRCNDKTYKFFKNLADASWERLQTMSQTYAQHLLKTGFENIQWNLMPHRVYCRTQGDIPKDIILHHANDTRPCGDRTSLDAKMDQFKWVREQLGLPAIPGI
jgi:hypothetical protein